MKRITGYISDAWSTFFKESLYPYTASSRTEFAFAIWSPLVFWLIIGFIVKAILLIPKVAGKYTKVNVSNSTDVLKQFIRMLSPEMSVGLAIILILIGLYFIVAFKNMFARRLFDIGVPIKISKTLFTFFTIVMLYTQLPAIIHLLNYVQTYKHIHLMSLPFTSNVVTVMLLAFVYGLLQILPTHMLSKR